MRDKVASGVAWSIAEKVGSMLLQMGVSIVILRLLTPEQMGIMAIPVVFSSLALVMVDSGFSQTLIRKAVPSEEDYKSVFVFNIAVSVLLYLLLVGAMPWIARFYGMPELVRISRLSATANTVQGILFSKNVSRYWNRPIPFTGFTATTAAFFAMIAIRLVIQWLFSVSLLSLRTKIGQTARKNNNALKNEMVTYV